MGGNPGESRLPRDRQASAARGGEGGTQTSRSSNVQVTKDLDQGFFFVEGKASLSGKRRGRRGRTWK